MTAGPPVELPDCPICAVGPVRLVWRAYPGYREPDTFDIAECASCRTRMALPLDVDATAVYEAIYRQADRIPGYDRYVRYAADIAREDDPLAYLAGRELAYWGIREALAGEPGRPLRILEVGSGLGYLTYALRRAGHEVDREQVLLEIRERDRVDSERDISPMRPADDAIVLDTSELTLEAVLDQLEGLVKQRMS